MTKWDSFCAGLFAFAYKPYEEFSRKGKPLTESQIKTGRVISVIFGIVIVIGMAGVFF